MATSSEIALPAADEHRRLLIGEYALAATAALAVEGLLNTAVGAGICAVLVVLLHGHHVAAIGRDEPADGAFLALALVPLAGVLAVVMPASQLTEASWPLLVVAPLVMAVALCARALELPPRALGLTLRGSGWQVLIALSGLPLGLVAYVLVSPQALASGANIALAVVSLCALAFTEELLFRGLLQPRLGPTFGRGAIAVTSVLSAAVALGVHSLGFAALAGVAAVGFGHATQRTGSIVGTSVARAIMFIGLLVVCPHLL